MRVAMTTKIFLSFFQKHDPPYTLHCNGTLFSNVYFNTRFVPEKVGIPRKYKKESHFLPWLKDISELHSSRVL